ncbi:ArsC/Spx/MgsR family protein [Rhodovulum sulfidophilum]|uniref:ArsC/Spx/MgsR family protein n=1 Tax=Rhodovulum sulfidophilum TaxID=35806 RepID=UPI0009BF5185|nr:ArsC/Spx/MgsR family protein [Rhodovulum sulfidophilum]
MARPSGCACRSSHPATCCAASPPFEELGLDDPSLADAKLLDAMMMHPILINRHIAITGKGMKLCQPSETVLGILDTPDTGPFRLGKRSGWSRA